MHLDGSGGRWRPETRVSGDTQGSKPTRRRGQNKNASAGVPLDTCGGVFFPRPGPALPLPISCSATRGRDGRAICTTREVVGIAAATVNGAGRRRFLPSPWSGFALWNGRFGDERSGQPGWSASSISRLRVERWSGVAARHRRRRWWSGSGGMMMPALRT